MIEPSDNNRFGQDARACYGIAQNQASGKIAVYRYRVNDRFAPPLEVHDALDDLNGEVDDAALVAAARAICETRAVRRDI